MTDPLDKDRVNTRMHTDIKRDGWIGQVLPGFMRPYAYLMRLDRPIGTWLLLLPGWWAILLSSGAMMRRPNRLEGGLDRMELWTLVLFGIGAVIMRGAGCIVNDLWDRDLDRQVARTAARPLASGAVSTRQAVLFLIVLLLIGLGILLQLSIVAVCLGVLSIPFIAAYPLMKRITWWPQAFLGLTFNFGAPMGWAAVTGVLALPALLLYMAGFFWTLGYDTIYAHQDIEDDIQVDIKSTARRLGGWNRVFVAAVYCVCWVLLEAAFITAGAGWLSCLFLTMPLMHVVWQLQVWQLDNPASALKVFRSNRDFGLLVMLAALV